MSEAPPWAATAGAVISQRKLTKKDAEVRAEWWRRKPWPCVALAVDPGATAGAAVLSPRGDTAVQVVKTFTVDTSTLEVEEVLNTARAVADDLRLPLVLVLESWGAGGMRGIDQWLGLGASVGAWTRAWALRWRAEACEEEAARRVMKRNAVARIPMTTWRSWMVDSTGTVDAAGVFTRHDSVGWKRAATATIAEKWPDIREIDGADAAEATLMGIYSMRSEAVGKLLSATHLKKHGF